MTVDLDKLRQYVGAVSTADDDVLTEALGASQAWVAARVKATSLDAPEVDQATLLLASRWFKRRSSPEGTSGFGQDGFVVTVRPNDPDVTRLLERHWDMSDGLDDDGARVTEGLGLG